MTVAHLPPAWTRPLTLADTLLIESLPDDMRAVVERYAAKNAVNPVEATEDTEYERGWQDAMDAIESELHMIHFPSPPSKEERERKRRREEERRARMKATAERSEATNHG